MKSLQKCTQLSGVFKRLESYKSSTLFMCTDLDVNMAHRYGQKYIKDPKSFGSDTVKEVSPPQPPVTGNKSEEETSIDITTGQLFRALVLTHNGVDYIVHVPIASLSSGASKVECHVQPVPSIGVSPASAHDLTSSNIDEGRIGNRIGNSGKWTEINWSTIPRDLEDLDRVTKIYESYADGNKEKLSKVRKWSSYTTKHIGDYSSGYNAISTDASQRQVIFDEGYSKLSD